MEISTVWGTGVPHADICCTAIVLHVLEMLPLPLVAVVVDPSTDGSIALYASYHDQMVRL